MPTVYKTVDDHDDHPLEVSHAVIQSMSISFSLELACE